MNRRDLLKYFAAGTVITPLIGAMPPMATLIETPKLQIFEPDPVRTPVDLSALKSVTVIFEKHDGSRNLVKFDPFHQHVPGSFATDDDIRCEVNLFSQTGSPVNLILAAKYRGNGILA